MDPHTLAALLMGLLCVGLLVWGFWVEFTRDPSDRD